MELEWSVVSNQLIEASLAGSGVVLSVMVLYLIAGRIWRWITINRKEIKKILKFDSMNDKMMNDLVYLKCKKMIGESYVQHVVGCRNYIELYYKRFNDKKRYDTLISIWRKHFR